MSAAPADLAFRVASIRVWASNAAVRGVQISYRHFLSNTLVDGELIATKGLDAKTEPTAEIQLLPGEHIVSVAVQVNAMVVVGLAIVTNFNRRADMAASCRVTNIDSSPPSLEVVRRLDASFTLSREQFTGIRAHGVPVPSLENMRSVAKETQQIIGVHTSTYAILQNLSEELAKLQSMIEEACFRRVLYPAEAMAAFNELLKDSRAITGLGWYGRVERCILHCKDLQRWLLGTSASNEITRLKFGISIETYSPSEAAKILRELQARRQFELAAKLYIQCEAPICISRLDADQFVLAGHGAHLQAMVSAFASSRQLTLHAVMSVFDNGGVGLIDTAVAAGDSNLLEWLVVDALLDPFNNNGGSDGVVITASQHQTREQRIRELCQGVEASSADHASKETIMKFLSKCKNREEFIEEIAQIAADVVDKSAADVVATTTEKAETGKAISFERLHRLVPKITSVHDFSQLYMIGKTILDRESLNRLVHDASTHIFQEKLVLDDSACAYLKIALRQAFEDDVLQEIEYETLNIKNVKVNMEGAEWVIALKRRIQLIEEQGKTPSAPVRSSVRNCIRKIRELLVAGIQSKACKRIAIALGCILVTVGIYKAAAWVGISSALSSLKSVVDMNKVAGTTEAEKVRSLASGSSNVPWLGRAKTMLSDCGVNPMHFITMLVGLIANEKGSASGDPSTDTVFYKSQNKSLHRPPASGKTANVRSTHSSSTNFDLSGCLRLLGQSGLRFAAWRVASLPKISLGTLCLTIGLQLLLFQNRWKVIAALLLALLVLVVLISFPAIRVNKSQISVTLIIGTLHAAIPVLAVARVIGQVKFFSELQRHADLSAAVAATTGGTVLIALSCGNSCSRLRVWGFGKRLKLVAYVTVVTMCVVRPRDQVEFLRFLVPMLIDGGSILISSVSSDEIRNIGAETTQHLRDFAEQGVAGDLQAASAVMVNVVSQIIDYWKQPSTLSWNNIRNAAIDVADKAGNLLLPLVAPSDHIPSILEDSIKLLCPSDIFALTGVLGSGFTSSVAFVAINLWCGDVVTVALPFIIAETSMMINHCRCLDGQIEDSMDIILIGSPMLRLWRVTKSSVRRTAAAVSGVNDVVKKAKGALRLVDVARNILNKGGKDRFACDQDLSPVRPVKKD